MGNFAGFLVSAFGGLVSWLVTRIGKRFALGAAFLVSYLAILTALFIALKGSILGLVYVADNPYLTMGFWLVWPDNAEAVMSAIIGADLAVFIYRIHLENLRAVSYIT